MSARDTLNRWGSRFAGALTFWSVLPPSLVAVITAYLGAGVDWIRDLGAFGVFASGLVGFVLASIGLAQAARWKLYRFEAKRRARLMGDSSPFDPMAPVYHDKRLYLRDLAPLGRRVVVGKSFFNCEIIGPGTVVLGLRSSEHKPFPALRDTGTFDVDVIEIDPRVESILAISFVDCDFVGCKFYHMTLLFTDRQNESLHWITKRSDQLVLPSSGEPQDAAK